MAEERIISFNLGSQHVAGAVFSKTAAGGLSLSRYERVDLLTFDLGEHLFARRMAILHRSDNNQG